MVCKVCLRLLITCQYNAVKCSPFAMTKIAEEDSACCPKKCLMFFLFLEKVMRNVLFDAMMISTGL